MEVQTPLPESVRKQGEAADALHRKLYPDQYPNAGGEQTDQGKETPAGAAKPDDKEKPGEQPKSDATKVETGKGGEARVEGTVEEWKQKYETLQGKYNAEVPQLHTTAAALRNQLQEALNRIKSLEVENSTLRDEKAKLAEKKEEEPPKQGLVGDSTLREEEITDPTLKSFKEEYPDIFEAVKKMVGPKPKEAPREEKKEPEKKTETPVEPDHPVKPDYPATDGRQTMLYFLNRDVPDWRQINVDPEFIKSLEVPDPMNPGKTKLQSINLAFEAADFTTVIGFFRDFKAAKAGASTGKEIRENPGEKEKKELSPEEKELAPPKGARPPGGAAEGTPTVTPQDLAKFYDEARRGLWGPITEEKFRKEEARLLAALVNRRT